MRGARENHFEVVKQSEQFLHQRFYDVDFEVDKYREELYSIDLHIDRQGYFEVNTAPSY
ncbi:hypothetical protein [Paenibacillus riograndensis]|uniref:hypothetical protein n=1 Tax=Paenibacillus riograndensis TaxID=483937 RepID=UPI000A7D8CAB|nr:hypothetical protein [Paenibacillus riograndensis]